MIRVKSYVIRRDCMTENDIERIMNSIFKDIYDDQIADLIQFNEIRTNCTIHMNYIRDCRTHSKDSLRNILTLPIVLSNVAMVFIDLYNSRKEQTNAFEAYEFKE